jgi:hypothetical protein
MSDRRNRLVWRSGPAQRAPQSGLREALCHTTQGGRRVPQPVREMGSRVRGGRAVSPGEGGEIRAGRERLGCAGAGLLGPCADAACRPPAGPDRRSAVWVDGSRGLAGKGCGGASANGGVKGCCGGACGAPCGAPGGWPCLGCVSSVLEVDHFIGQQPARPMLADVGLNVGSYHPRPAVHFPLLRPAPPAMPKPPRPAPLSAMLNTAGQDPAPATPQTPRGGAPPPPRDLSHGSRPSHGSRLIVA